MPAERRKKKLCCDVCEGLSHLSYLHGNEGRSGGDGPYDGTTKCMRGTSPQQGEMSTRQEVMMMNASVDLFSSHFYDVSNTR